MTNRIALRATNLLAVTAIAGIALLGLTACGSDTKPSVAGNQSQTPPASHPATGTPSAPNSSPKATATVTATPTATTPTARATTTAKKTLPPATLPGDCTAATLKATVTTLTRPINHVLLTVTNTGKAPCNLYYYPDLRFDAEQQAVIPAVEDSKPHAVVTIDPGSSAYAAVGTSAADGSGGNGKIQKQVEVFFEARDQSGSLPGSLKLALPANTYVDDKAFVTYWQSDLQDAVVW